jgi:hypothetical protein
LAESGRSGADLLRVGRTSGWVGCGKLIDFYISSLTSKVWAHAVIVAAEQVVEQFRDVPVRIAFARLASESWELALRYSQSQSVSQSVSGAR